MVQVKRLSYKERRRQGRRGNCSPATLHTLHGCSATLLYLRVQGGRWAGHPGHQHASLLLSGGFSFTTSFCIALTFLRAMTLSSSSSSESSSHTFLSPQTATSLFPFCVLALSATMAFACFASSTSAKTSSISTSSRSLGLYGLLWGLAGLLLGLGGFLRGLGVLLFPRHDILTLATANSD
ncbi:MAG: hypothetical protein JOS17DRAFT_194172 [Linnemannia elongata]|nr:MAG: hypothetical protein JOS17DRAFT_194172 [Linnemannia elongata]